VFVLNWRILFLLEKIKSVQVIKKHEAQELKDIYLQFHLKKEQRKDEKKNKKK
jgi:hypothetical protein